MTKEYLHDTLDTEELYTLCKAYFPYGEITGELYNKAGRLECFRVMIDDDLAVRVMTHDITVWRKPVVFCSEETHEHHLTFKEGHTSIRRSGALILLSELKKDADNARYWIEELNHARTKR